MCMDMFGIGRFYRSNQPLFRAARAVVSGLFGVLRNVIADVLVLHAVSERHDGPHARQRQDQ